MKVIVRQTDVQTNRQTDTTEIIYHADLRVVENSTALNAASE